MDVGGATQMVRSDQVVSPARDSRASSRGATGRSTALARATTAAPAERFRLADGTTFGVIASTTAPFCRTCDRARLTADGTCSALPLRRAGLDLRELLRIGASDEEIAGADRRRRGASRTDRGRRGARRARRPRRAVPDRGPPRRSPARDAHPGRLMAAPRRADPTADPAQHRQHRPAVRRHRYPAPSDRAARLLARRRARCKRAGLDYWDKVDLWVHPDWFAFRDAMSRERCLYFSANADASYWRGAVSRPNSVLVFGSETEGMPPRILEKHPERCFRIPMPGDGAEPQPGQRRGHRAVRGARGRLGVEPCRRGWTAES